MTKERLEEIKKIIHTAEVKGCMIDVSIAREMAEAISENRSGVFDVVVGNYYPEEVVYTATSLSGALAVADYLSDCGEYRVVQR